MFKTSSVLYDGLRLFNEFRNYCVCKKAKLNTANLFTKFGEIVYIFRTRQREEQTRPKNMVSIFSVIST